MDDCPFCNVEQTDTNRFIRRYQYWSLILQLDEKLRLTRQAAGLLVANRHIETSSQASAEEFGEVASIVKESARLLCEKVGVTYTDQEIVGFNQGAQAGQTVKHAHIHVLPIAEEDEPEMKVRAGIGGAFEALRCERLGD